MESTSLFSELCALYVSTKDAPNVMSFRLRLRDAINGKLLEDATKTAMLRYPYFCVELKKQGREFVFVKNDRPAVIVHSEQGVELNSADSNYHLFSLSWYEDWFILYVSHALTDGTGVYRFLQTLLYYYLSDYYKIELNCPGVWLVTDPISEEELTDPGLSIEEVPVEKPKDPPAPGLNVVKKAGLQKDTEKTVHSIVISESEFMRFNCKNEGSPATMIALLLGRAFADMYPDASEKIRVNVCVNLRKGTNTPLAHHGFVGGIWLEYMEEIRNWPLDKQMVIFRGRLFFESTKKKLLATAYGNKRTTEKMLALETDEERIAASREILNTVRDLQTATISYVGKAAFGDIEQYIEEFHVWVPAVYENVLIELSAVNNRMYVDFIQNFADRRYFDSFVNQLIQKGIDYQYQGTNRLELPGVQLPWT